MSMEEEVSAQESGRDRLNLLLRNLGPGARSAWALEGVWAPEQWLGALLALLGMREARGTRWEVRIRGLGGIMVRDLLDGGKGGAICWQ